MQVSFAAHDKSWCKQELLVQALTEGDAKDRAKQEVTGGDLYTYKCQLGAALPYAREMWRVTLWVALR